MKIDPEIVQELKKAYNTIRNSDGRVSITSAHTMSDSEKKALVEKLPMLKNADITYEVDASILAGVVITFGSKMIDLSLRNELTNLQHFIYERI